jgi:hypothetical protein
MDTRRLLIGTLVGGIAMYVLGYLIFEAAFGGFYAANVGSASGVTREASLQWAVVLGSLALGALITLAIESRPGPRTIGMGFMTGAAVGFLLWFGVDFLRYGMTNVPNLARTIVDPLLEIVRNGACGAIIVAALNRTAGRAAAGARERRAGVGV